MLEHVFLIISVYDSNFYAKNVHDVNLKSRWVRCFQTLAVIFYEISRFFPHKHFVQDLDFVL